MLAPPSISPALESRNHPDSTLQGDDVELALALDHHRVVDVDELLQAEVILDQYR